MTTTTQDSGAGIERERIAKAINDRWGLLCGWTGEPAIPGQWSRADLSKEFADAVLRASPVVEDEAREREGAPQEGAGSREPSPSVSALSGFHPSRSVPARLQELSKNASPGFWYTVDPPWGDGSWIVAGDPDPHAGTMVCDCEDLNETRPEDGLGKQDDAAFIAAAVNFVRLLLSREAGR